MDENTINLPVSDVETTMMLSMDNEDMSEDEEIHYLLDYCSDVGIKKKVNQDACCIRILKTTEHTIVLAVVCDGVGGMEEGEFASNNTILAFHNWFDYSLSKIIVEKQEDNLFEELSEDIKKLIIEQNEAVYTYAREKGIQTGTTVTAMLFVDREYLIAQIGDSRAYMVNNGVIQLTEDQSFVAGEVKAGRMTEQEARCDKRRNIILQCLGATPFIEPVYVNGKVEKGAIYFLCSDGFVHELEKTEIELLMNAEEFVDLEQTHDRLNDVIQMIKKRGEKDNITVVLVRT